MYYLEVLGFCKLIRKIRKHPLKKNIIRDIEDLAYDPGKGKYIPRHDIYELKYPNLRIYYLVKEGGIIIFGKDYEGTIIILGHGNKDQQKRKLK